MTSSRTRRLEALAPLAITALAAGLRFYHLKTPNQIIFDETYYANDAHRLLHHGIEDGFVVHPPVGKWLIAAGEKLFGYNAFGWRVAAALFGSLTILLVYLAARELLNTIAGAAAASLLLCLENLHFVQSRIAMLDIFLCFFIVAAFWFLMLDRRSLEKTSLRAKGWAPVPPTPSPTAKPSQPEEEDAPSESWVAALKQDLYSEDSLEESAPAATSSAGTLAAEWASPGVVAAVPPEAGFDGPPGSNESQVAGGALGAGGASTVGPVSDEPAGVTRRRRVSAGAGIWKRRRVWRYLAGLAIGLGVATKWSALAALFGMGALSLVWEVTARRRAGFKGISLRTLIDELPSLLIAFLVIPLAVYVASYTVWFLREGTGFPGVFVAWFHNQQAIWHYHATLDVDHAYKSKAWSWLVMRRPVSYYWKGPGTEVLGMGNPVVFWGALPMYPYLVWRTIKKDWRAGAILTLFAIQFLPWAVATRPLFFFYMLPMVPFMCLGLAYVLERMAVRPAGKGFAAGYLVLAAGAFWYFYPIVAAWPLSGNDWQLRMLFRSWI